MNFLDICFLILTCVCVAKSIFSNFVANLIVLCLWIAAAVALEHGADTMALVQGAPTSIPLDLFNFFFFPICVIVIFVIGFILNRIPNSFPSSILHKSSCVFFGIAKTMTLCFVAIFYIEKYVPSLQDDLQLAYSITLLNHLKSLF